MLHGDDGPHGFITRPMRSSGSFMCDRVTMPESTYSSCEIGTLSVAACTFVLDAMQMDMEIIKLRKRRELLNDFIP